MPETRIFPPLIKFPQLLVLIAFSGLAVSVTAADVDLLHSFTADRSQIEVEDLAGIAFGADGHLYSLGGKNARLVRYPQGQDSAEIVLETLEGVDGKPNLSGLAWVDARTLATADAGDTSIRLVGVDGATSEDFGEKGSKAGMLKKPQALTFSINRRLYIADSSADQISVYNRSGVFLYSLGQAESDPKQRLKSPQQVAVDAAERVYVLQPGSSAVISVYDSSGSLLKRLGDVELKSLLGAKFDIGAMTADAAGRLFITNAVDGKIIQLDWNTPKVQRSFGSKGSGPGQYQNAFLLAASDDNRLAVADSRNKKIDIYNLNESATAVERAWLPNVGKVEFKAANCSAAYLLHDSNFLCLDAKANTVRILSPDGKALKNLEAAFKDPLQAAFDEEHIVILNKTNVMVFSTAGKLLTQFGKSGRYDGEFGSAEDIFLTNNRIYVVESGNKRVQIFSIKGVYLDKLPQQAGKGNEIFKKPTSVAVDGNGNIYVADDTAKSIFVYSNAKELLYEISPPSPAAFISIADLALDTDNNLYVLCATGLKEQTVQVYSGPVKIFEFGAYSKKTPTGIGKGVALSVSPTAKTQVGVFDIVDSKNTGLLVFDYLQVPPPVGELTVAGGIEYTRLGWRQPPGAYINQFNVYASNTEGGGYELLKTTSAPEVEIKHKSGEGHRFYKVAAVNGFGDEGPLSSPRENRFQPAYAAYNAEKYDDAIAILNQSLQSDARQPEAVRLLGLSLIAQKQYTQAAETFNTLSGFDGYKTEGLNLRIEALYLNKDYAEASALLATTMTSAPNDINSYINCGRLNLKIGDAIGAVECLEKGLKRDANNPELNLLLARAYIDVGAKDQGLQQLEKTAALAPENPEVWVRIGDIHMLLGKTADAKKNYQQALTLNEADTGAQLGLARLHMQAGDINNARNIALKLAGNTETAATGNYLLGRIAMQEKKYGEAVLALSKATRMDTDNVDAWLLLADAHVALEKPELAIAALRGATNADPASPAVLKRLGLQLLNGTQTTEAADMLARAADISFDDYELVLSASDALFRDKQYNRAADYIRRAVKLNEKDVRGLQLGANIAKQRGKTGEAIEYLKSATALKKDGYDLHVELGALYLDNNLYDNAKVVLEQATLIDKSRSRAHVLLGDMYLGRRLFDKAITDYEKAVKLDGSAENRLLLDTAYAEKKRSLEFSSNAPQLALEDLRLQPVFSAAYKQYADKPIGSIRLRNTSGVDYGNLQLLFEIKGYMDFPTRQTIEKLPANGVQEIPLLAVFNNKVLEIDEDTGVQAEIRLEYIRDGRNDNISITQRMTLFGKNAIVWGEPNMVGSFVTPKDDALRDFVRQAINDFKLAAGPLNENVVSAMTLFNVFSGMGMRYEIDPSNPFTSLKDDQIDYVQFARETLRLRSGDCDDLSVLFSAALENLGIETAILDVPKHLLMMFNTGLPPEARDLISAQDELLVVRDGGVWVPLEVTMIAHSFAEAWAEGAKKYHANQKAGTLTVVPLRQAWQQYQPVTLKPAGYELKTPASEKVQPRVEREQMLLLEKSLDRLVEPFRAIAAYNPKDELARMQIAIIYAKYGLYDRAFEEFDALLSRNSNNGAVFNNRGNIYYAKGDFERAGDAYQQAERLDPTDGGIKLNLALLAYQQGNIPLASRKFKEASKSDKSIESRYATFAKLLQN